VRILVTNDDGIESVGLHVLAKAVEHFGDVTVVAPLFECSGAGASIGTLTGDYPVVHKQHVPALGSMESWSVSGPPALCVMYAQLGAFGEPFDLIVSGINPGQNVGWSVYHSGTIGAALTGRNRGASGLAVSLGFNGKELEGQTWPEIVAGMQWETAATIAVEVLEGFFASPPDRPVVMNLNVPNGPLDAVEGWDVGVVGSEPPRRLTKGRLVEGDTDEHGQVYRLEMDWGSGRTLIEGTDGFLVANKRASLSWLGDLTNTTPDDAHHAAITSRLNALLPKGV